ncbi:MAG: L,D-transpeptidase [Patescibacteria group bacterium]
MPKAHSSSLTMSTPFLIFFLIALLLGILYLAAFLKNFGSDFKPKLLAAEVDFAHTTGQYDTSAQTATFLDRSVNIPEQEQEVPRPVLGDTTSNKHIEVDLTNQRLYAFEGDRKVFDFLISSGKWGKTPTGTFHIWTKFRYTKMSGGSKALHTYYYLPNVPYVMFFSNAEVPGSAGFSLHGTYWHNNFGHPMSHGCVNMKTEEAEQIYYWSTPTLPEGKTSMHASVDNPGTEIIIYGEPPAN